MDSKTLSDDVRLHEDLARVYKSAAARTVQQLTSVPTRLLTTPRIGEKLDVFSPREVRRILVGQYEMRHEIRMATIWMLRVWHTRERRYRSPYT